MAWVRPDSPEAITAAAVGGKVGVGTMTQNTSLGSSACTVMFTVVEFACQADKADKSGPSESVSTQRP